MTMSGDTGYANEIGDGSGGLNLDDPDRLPWLEPAEGGAEPRDASLARIATLVIVGLVLLGLIVGGGYWLKHRDTGMPSEARLIPAQGGDYKIPANTTAGKSFQGTGDTSYATSQGVDTDGKIDASRLPETPMAGVSRGSIAKDDAGKATAGAAKAGNSVSAAVRDETGSKAGPATTTVAASAGGAMVQLGAYNNQAVALDAWKKLAKRFDYLAVLSSGVEKAEVGGSTVYRLRAGAGSAANAATLCGKLKVAGENCIVVR